MGGLSPARSSAFTPLADLGHPVVLWYTLYCGTGPLAHLVLPPSFTPTACLDLSMLASFTPAACLDLSMLAPRHECPEPCKVLCCHPFGTPGSTPPIHSCCMPGSINACSQA
eukprot:1161282-Pelagomonas_calceolata.AAC.13